MRHNKLAGTRFLLGSRKHKPSTFTSSSTSRNTSDNTSDSDSDSDIATDCNCGNTNTGTTNNNMLHSKSTYFYRWFRESLDLVVSGLSTKNANKTSKASYLVPAVCGAALLGAFCVIVNPAAGKTEAVYAVSDDECQTTANDQGICTMELGIMMNGTNDAFNEAPATKLSTTEATFRDYDFTVRAVDTKDGYKLYANALGSTGADGTDYTNKLVNMDDPEGSVITALTGEVVGSNIPAGQWGYAFTKGDNLTTAPDTLTYKAVPSGTTETSQPIDTGADTIYDKTSNTHTDMNYKLYFGAKASDGMRSGHYKTQVQLSLVADPKMLVSATMQGFAQIGNCSYMDIGDSTQLIDDRSTSGFGQTTYWVSRLKDGKCWMTQNLDLGLAQGDVLRPADTDITTAYTVPALNNYRDPGMVNYKPSVANIAYASSACGDPANAAQCGAYFENYTGEVFGDEKAHYLIGNYYSWEIAVAGMFTENTGSICPKGWRLPTNNEYGALISDLDANVIRVEPYYFVPAGTYNSEFAGVANYGNYWSGTPGSSSGSIANAFNLNFVSNRLTVPFNYRLYGFPIRCIVK